ncbi:branched-chain amino acid ABC transporter permease [Candidatus Poribacteria bacterium]|nr:MAG: branched-chain amino acid ABC transporter permease [Candidatus Poribacteria bacterium]
MRDKQLLLAVIIGSALAPLATLPAESGGYYVRVMNVILLYCIITSGLSLLMGYAGQISLGHAAFFGLGAYGSGLLAVKLSLSPWLAMPIAVLGTALVAAAVGVPVLKLKGHYLAMATLGFGEIIYVFLKELNWLTGDPAGLIGIPPFKLFGRELISSISQYYLTWAFLSAVLLISVSLIRSRIGRALRAIHGDELAAGALGVDVSRLKLQVFVLSAVYGAVAGSLYAHFEGFIGYSTFGLMLSIKLVTMVVIGGMSSIWGALLGTAVLTALPQFLTVFKEFEMAVYGAILIGTMIFSPKGIAGALARRRGVERGKAAA